MWAWRKLLKIPTLFKSFSFGPFSEAKLWMSSHIEDLRLTGFRWEESGVLGPSLGVTAPPRHKVAWPGGQWTSTLTLFLSYLPTPDKVKAKWKTCHMGDQTTSLWCFNSSTPTSREKSYCSSLHKKRSLLLSFYSPSDQLIWSNAFIQQKCTLHVLWNSKNLYIKSSGVIIEIIHC